jgi:hypothetical protein
MVKASDVFKRLVVFSLVVSHIGKKDTSDAEYAGIQKADIQTFSARQRKFRGADEGCLV